MIVILIVSCYCLSQLVQFAKTEDPLPAPCPTKNIHAHTNQSTKPPDSTYKNQKEMHQRQEHSILLSPPQIRQSRLQIILHRRLLLLLLRFLQLPHRQQTTKLLPQFQIILIGHHLHQFVHLIDRRGARCGGIHGRVHVRRLDVEVLELLFEFVHDGGYFIDVHGGQALVHAFDDGFHGFGDLVHSHGCFEAGGYGVYSGAEAETV
mmetsp:Transcript_19420/g.33326  ORF Transcript_19420/g.33326 Transcript_19420/m.33326 type:complete len:206 (+) Transcript_19420:226-843(+)